MRATSLLTIALVLICPACERRGSTTSRPSSPTPSAASERESEPVARPAPALPDPVEVSFPTPDHVVLHGTLHPAADPTAGAVVLVHQLGSTRSEWASVVAALREEPALTVLAFDLPRHGESTAGADGHAPDYGRFGAGA